MKRKSQAIVLVVSVLGAVMVMGAAIVLMSMHQMHAAQRMISAVKAQYAAEAGLVTARALLADDREKNRIDSADDAYFARLSGSDADVDDDGTRQSAWHTILAPDGSVYGRFAVRVQDEAGKIDINSVGEDSRGGRGNGLFELDVDAVCAAAGIKRGKSIVGYRKGADGAYGVKGVDDNNNAALYAGDGLDNDADGSIDEAGEGIDEPSESGYGDDRFFLTPQDCFSYFSAPASGHLRDLFTVYSKDRQTDLQGRTRILFSNADERMMTEAFLVSGVSAQKAMNVKDAADADHAQSMTRIYTASFDVSSPQGGAYTSDGRYYHARGGAASAWTVSGTTLSAGDYYVFFHGVAGEPVGRVSAAGIEAQTVYSQEGLSGMVTVTGREWSFTVEPLAEKDSYLRSVEFVSLEEKQGMTLKVVRGREAVIINEIMIRPTEEISVAADQSPGMGWTFDNSVYRCPPGAGQGRFVFKTGRSGVYYVRFFASNKGSLIGNIVVAGERLDGAYDGAWTSRPVSVNDELTVLVENTSLTETASFGRIELTQEPDGEYVELLNVSNTVVDVGGFTFEAAREGSNVLGWPARIPEGTTIEPYGRLVCAVDADDVSSPSFLRGNGLSFARIWSLDAIQLEFTNAVEGNDDIIPDFDASLVLRDKNGAIADAVEYSARDIVSFAALERGDTTAVVDKDGDGYFDGWYLSGAPAAATPGERNNNDGIKIIDSQTFEVTFHDEHEQCVKDIPMENIAYACNVASGEPWQRVSMRDVGLLLERFSVYSTTLALDASFEGNGFKKVANGYFSNQRAQYASWRWTDIEPGSYDLVLVADEASTACVSVVIDNGTTTTLKGLYVQSSRIDAGNITVVDSSPVAITIINEVDQPVAIKAIMLCPVVTVRGMINVNTAGSGVMNALFGQYADKVVTGRPYGAKDGRFLGAGDVALVLATEAEAAVFARIAPDLTTRSDVYDIQSVAEVSTPMAGRHKLETVVER